MRWSTLPKYKYQDVRIIKKFAWYPISEPGTYNWIWLEFYYIKQQYDYFGWYTIYISFNKIDLK